MTTEGYVDPAAKRSRLSPFLIGLAVAVTIPGVLLRFVAPGWSPPLLAGIFGIAVVGAAFELGADGGVSRRLCQRVSPQRARTLTHSDGSAATTCGRCSVRPRQP